MKKLTDRRKLSRMIDQLQIMEVAHGWHYMMASELNASYEKLRREYEARTGKPFIYQPHS